MRVANLSELSENSCGEPNAGENSSAEPVARILSLVAGGVNLTSDLTLITFAGRKEKD
jgi:hypothetical protein